MRGERDGQEETAPARGGAQATPASSLDQSYHLAPLYSVKGVHDVAPIEHGKQTFHRSRRVPAIFPQDAPSVLNGANDGILVGIVHDGTQLHESGNQAWRQIFVPVWRLRFYVSETIATRRAFCP
jgi:hypothetical protein